MSKLPYFLDTSDICEGYTMYQDIAPSNIRAKRISRYLRPMAGKIWRYDDLKGKSRDAYDLMFTRSVRWHGVAKHGGVNYCVIDCELLMLKLNADRRMTATILRSLMEKDLAEYTSRRPLGSGFCYRYELGVVLVASSDIMRIWRIQNGNELYREYPKYTYPMSLLGQIDPPVKESQLLVASGYSDDISFSHGHGYVYLVQKENSDLYKIGRTKYPDERIRRFEVVLPFPIEPIHIIECEYYRQAEHILHEKYAEFRKGGEWFQLTPEQVEEIKAIKRM